MNLQWKQMVGPDNPVTSFGLIRPDSAGPVSGQASLPFNSTEQPFKPPAAMTPAERAGYEANQKQMAAETMARSGNSGGSSVVPSDTQAVGTQASQASSPTYQLFKPPEAMTPAERAGYEANQKQMAAETMVRSGNSSGSSIVSSDTQAVGIRLAKRQANYQLFKPPDAMTPAERAGVRS